MVARASAPTRETATQARKRIPNLIRAQVLLLVLRADATAGQCPYSAVPTLLFPACAADHCCLVACGAGFGTGLRAAAGARVAVPPRRIVTLFIFTGSYGRSPLLASRGMAAIFLTRSTLGSSHCPKIVYLPFKRSA